MTTTTEQTEKPAMDINAIVAELGPKFAGRAAGHDVDGSFVAENFQEMRERKLFSAAIPTELGGGGASHAEICEFLRGLAHYDSATALSFSMHSEVDPEIRTGG